MDERVERRSPDRQRFVLRFLRRIALAALLIAFALWAVPRLLVEAGVLGPTAAERIDEAARAVAIARTYGGSGGPALKAAEAGLERARLHAAAGDERAARKEAVSAAASAILAQKAALVERSDREARAEAVYDALEGEVNALEKLYGEVTPGLARARVGELLSMMKATRQATGAVFLAYEQEDYAAVIEREPRAREAVAAMRRALEP
jgi:hypothetical protein